ncbi:MAG: GNAT family N-acetyltransferase [Solirubrobacterales bacterium]|nr:GNAT family N-acetyltransferase [Solirubrobacterales bacterium]
MSPRPIEFPVEGLSDGTVRVRLIADADLPAIAAACRDPEIVRYTTIPAPYEPRHAREWQLRAEAGQAAGTDIGALVVDRGSDELLGSVGMHGLDPANGRASAGYWVAAEARGRGVATRGLWLLCRFAFDEIGVERIELWIEPENEPSRRVAQRVGFRSEGLLRSFMPIQGVRRDMLMYSLLPGELR